jgi:hypothetical protein
VIQDISNFHLVREDPSRPHLKPFSSTCCRVELFRLDPIWAARYCSIWQRHLCSPPLAKGQGGGVNGEIMIIFRKFGRMCKPLYPGTGNQANGPGAGKRAIVFRRRLLHLKCLDEAQLPHPNGKPLRLRFRDRYWTGCWSRIL